MFAVITAVFLGLPLGFPDSAKVNGALTPADGA